VTSYRIRRMYQIRRYKKNSDSSILGRKVLLSLIHGSMCPCSMHLSHGDAPEEERHTSEELGF
ncbi:hypothetical protein ACJX0J_017635, partial [Zea mays]